MVPCLEQTYTRTSLACLGLQYLFSEGCNRPFAEQPYYYDQPQPGSQPHFKMIDASPGRVSAKKRVIYGEAYNAPRCCPPFLRVLVRLERSPFLCFYFFKHYLAKSNLLSSMPPPDACQAFFSDITHCLPLFDTG